MDKIKEFLAKQTIGFYLAAVAIVLSIVSLIAYGVTIGDKMGTSATVFVMLCLVIVVQVAVVVLAQTESAKKYCSFGSAITGVLCAVALLMFFISRMTWFMDIASSNDVPPIHAAFIFSAIMIVVTLVANVAAGFFSIRKKN